MYLICLSGSVVVLAPYLLRWEQPTIKEFQYLPQEAAPRAWDDLLEEDREISGGALLMLPRENEPRARLVSANGNWYLVSGIWYLVSGIWYLVSGIWYLVSGIWYLVSGIWYLNEDGRRAADVSQPWTDSMVDLHDKLHLPAGVGLVVVGTFAALLCGLIISGFVSHPRIFRDAFNFRLNGSRHLEQADLHNRLSVRGAR